MSTKPDESTPEPLAGQVVALFGRNQDNRAFDLPPRWDGEPITWGQWAEHDTTLAYHAPADALACEKCGTVAERSVNWGSRPPATETVLSPVPKRTRKGREYINYEQVPAHPVRDLCALRCRHCGHDQVTDERTGELWDLGPEDYTAEGSGPIDTLF